MEPGRLECAEIERRATVGLAASLRRKVSEVRF